MTDRAPRSERDGRWRGPRKAERKKYGPETQERWETDCKRAYRQGNVSGSDSGEVERKRWL